VTATLLDVLLDDRFALQPIATFLDLIWDNDWTSAELLAVDPGMMIDARHNQRRIVVVPMRGELRYWLSTEREPMRMGLAETELGVVAVDELASLCREFLESDMLPGALQTPRFVLRGPRISVETEATERAPRPG
jgi:hypothetical protein